MKCRCLHRPQMTPSPDGTHTCPSCGSSVYLRDAGYERFTDPPLPMPMRDITVVAAAIVAEVGLLPLPTRAQLNGKRECEDSGRGPGCGTYFLPINPTQKRCDACKGTRWLVSALPEKPCVGCLVYFVPRTALVTRCAKCQKAYRDAGKQASYERAKHRRALQEANVGK